MKTKGKLFPKKELNNRLVNCVAAVVLSGIGFILLFCDLAEDMLNNDLRLFDQGIIHAVMNIRIPLITELMKLISAMGSSTIMISIAVIAALFLFVVRRHYWDAIMLILVLNVSYIMNWLLKLAFHRDRPAFSALVPAPGYSFPSGHAMVSFAFYGMLIYLLLTNFKRGKSTYLLSFFIAMLVLGIGISRIYLGVHYPSDVIAGYAAGGFCLTVSILGLYSLRHRKKISKYQANNESNTYLEEL